MSFPTDEKWLVHEILIPESNFVLMVGKFVRCCIAVQNFSKLKIEISGIFRLFYVISTHASNLHEQKTLFLEPLREVENDFKFVISPCSVIIIVDSLHAIK